MPDPIDTIRLVASAARLGDLAKEEGERYGPLVLLRPASARRDLMRSNPHFRSFGTLRFLLGAARERFENEPTAAREITAAVLDFVDDVEGPSHVHEIGLRGLAWKEHANALRANGDLRNAHVAVERSIAIFGEASSLQFDAAQARLLAATIYRNMGDTRKALALARECESVFRDYDQHTYSAMARICEGVILFAEKQFAEALQIFTSLAEEAELGGDRVTLARALNNAAECARELGDLAAARDLYPRALAHFDELNLPSEAARVRWGYALSLATEGKRRLAVWELNKVRAVYLTLGRNSDAASAALDVVRVRFEADEDVRDLCSELVTTLTAAGLTQNAIEALAYLREQARRGTITTNKITQVRAYFGELANSPTLLFARPPDQEED